MRILLVTLEYPPIEGGVSRYLETFVRALEGHEVAVWVPKLPRWIYPRWIGLIFLTFWRVLRSRPDCIVISHILPCGYPVLITKWILRVPYAVICHGLDLLAPLDRPWKHYAAEVILGNAKIVITNSQFTASLLARYAQDPSRAHVIPPIPQELYQETPSRAERSDPVGIVTLRVIPRRGTSASGLATVHSGDYLLSVSRLVPRKGIDTALAAFAKIVGEFQNLQYLIAGDGPDRSRLEGLTKKFGLSDRVRFLGNVSRDELTKIYADATLFVLPTRAPHADAEGFGAVFLEAALFGKAVVAGRSGGVQEAVIDHETGLLVSPYNPQETADAIRKLLTDPTLREQLGKNGANRVHQQFTLAQIKQSLCSLFP